MGKRKSKTNWALGRSKRKLFEKSLQNALIQSRDRIPLEGLLQTIICACVQIKTARSQQHTCNMSQLLVKKHYQLG